MSEAQEQEAVIEWCDWARVPIFAIPNGGKRNPAEAAHLKRQGVRAGVPDLFMPIASSTYHGLFIEMKAGKNKPTENQLEWIARLERQGYKACVCVGATQAIETIIKYLE